MARRLLFVAVPFVIPGGGCCAVAYVTPPVASSTIRNVDAALVAEQPFDPGWWEQFEGPGPRD